MSNARGRGRGRGGGVAPRAQPKAAPLAAQMRPVRRLEEPKEMAVLRRFKDLGAVQVRSVYGQSGLLKQEVFVPASVVTEAGYENVAPEGDYIDLLEAEQALARHKARVERERALARRETRLPEARRRASWGSLSPEEKRVLTLSQKEYNSFRASQGGQPGATAPPGSGTPETGGKQATSPPTPPKAESSKDGAKPK